MVGSSNPADLLKVKLTRNSPVDQLPTMHFGALYTLTLGAQLCLRKVGYPQTFASLALAYDLFLSELFIFK